jgi:hypothetical protein
MRNARLRPDPSAPAPANPHKHPVRPAYDPWPRWNLWARALLPARRAQLPDNEDIQRGAQSGGHLIRHRDAPTGQPHDYDIGAATVLLQQAGQEPAGIPTVTKQTVRHDQHPACGGLVHRGPTCNISPRPGKPPGRGTRDDPYAAAQVVVLAGVADLWSLVEGDGRDRAAPVPSRRSAKNRPTSSRKRRSAIICALVVWRARVVGRAT